MVSSFLLDSHGNVIHNLTQWDVNQKLIVGINQTVTTAPKVHFCNKNTEKALVVESTLSDNKIIADIPNILLQEPHRITAYVYLETDIANDSWKTIQTIEIPMRKRQKPDDYEYVENVHVVFLSEMIKIVETLNQDVRDAESAREENESVRISNENTRIQQEIQRQEKIEQAIKDTNDATKKAVDAATEVMNLKVTETVNKAVSDANNAITGANQAASSANNASDRANDLINDLEQYGAVKVSDTEPESENVDVWIDDSERDEYTLPEINDTEENAVDTWSSKKIAGEFRNVKSDTAELKGDLDYQNENVSNGEGKIFEYIAGRSHVTDYDRSLCTISIEVPNAMYGNGFTADDDLLLTKIHIDANTIRVLVNTIDSTYDWTVYSDVSVTDGVANVSIPVKKGQSVFVGWQDGTVQYSPNISGFECFAYTNYKFSNSKITVKYLVSFNLEYSYYDKTEWYDIKRLVDKNELIWLAIGDSITLGKTNNDVSYVDYIREKININVIKEGHSGWTLNRLMQKFSSFDTENTADIITIFAGTNDFNVSAGSGSESDKYSSSCATIWALCNFAMPYLQKRYPTKPIIFFTPLQRKYTNSDGYPQEMIDDNGVTLREYAQAFIDAGKKYGIPVIDLYSISGIGVNNINDMTNDGIHPNEIGQKRIANIILSEIMKYTQIN